MGFMSTFRTDLADTLTIGSLVGSTTDGIIRPDKRLIFVVNSENFEISSPISSTI